MVETEVSALGKTFSSFLQTKGKIVKTNNNKEYTVLPYVFERIDKSDVFIIRKLNTEFIPKDFMTELKDSLK